MSLNAFTNFSFSSLCQEFERTFQKRGFRKGLVAISGQADVVWKPTSWARSQRANSHELHFRKCPRVAMKTRHMNRRCRARASCKVNTERAICDYVSETIANQPPNIQNALRLQKKEKETANLWDDPYPGWAPFTIYSASLPVSSAFSFDFLREKNKRNYSCCVCFQVKYSACGASA